MVGPTASGKTEASIEVARALEAEIVCVDSMLVYRGMDVGTAKPTADQRSAVAHHLLDVADPAEPFSVARFQRLAAQTLADLARRGRPALLVGGGGLYYRAVVDGLAFPGTEPGDRGLLEAEASAVGPAPLYARLAAFDPDAAARIDPPNVRRTVRALEVAAITGRSFSSFARAWNRYPPEAVRAAGVDLWGAVLHRRIEARMSAIMPGLLRETAALLANGSGGFLTAIQAIGYAEAAACLEGTLTEAEAAARTVRRTKALARRQMAWLRRDPRIRWFPAGEDGAPGVVGEVVRYLREGAAAGRRLDAAGRTAGAGA